ncbi:MAG: hypothetical protein AAB588_01430 [Patescibacteria group bacterium]
MKLAEKYKALDLRKKGISYRQIINAIPVSRSTLSLWLRDIVLTHEQKRRLLSNRAKGAYKGAKVQQEKRVRKTQLIIQQAEKEFLTLKKDMLFLGGLFLYWAEGDKHRKEMVKFTNSDPMMISFMMKWFRKICYVPENKFRVQLHIHDFHIRGNVEKFWSKITGVSQKQFYKTYIKETSLPQRRNVLYNGTCAVRVNDVNLFRKIQGWRNALTQYSQTSL